MKGDQSPACGHVWDATVVLYCANALLYGFDVTLCGFGIRHMKLLLHCVNCPLRIITLWEFVIDPFMLNPSCPVLANGVDPDQLASEEAN